MHEEDLHNSRSVLRISIYLSIIGLGMFAAFGVLRGCGGMSEWQ